MNDAAALADRLPAPARDALKAIWAGTETVILDSPPGAGKTEAISLIAPLLAGAGRFPVTVASPTVAGAYLIAERIQRQNTGVPVMLTGGSFTPRRAAGVPCVSGNPAPGEIYVSTIASRGAGRGRTGIMIVDEAYQATALAVRNAARGADQLLLVGDPGQIGPVIPFDQTGFDMLEDNPAGRAPDVFASRKGTVRTHLESTWRLGAATVEAIAPLYSFPFASARSESGYEGNEILVAETGATSVIDPRLMRTAADRACGLARRTVVRDGREKAATVAVIATRNEQTSILASMLAARAEGAGIVVGTADLLQGAEYDCVVAIDPLAGAATATGHAVALGRLCVMLSRHRTHLTFVTASQVARLLDRETEWGTVGMEVRERLAKASNRKDPS